MLNSDNTLMLVVDIQERLIPVLHEAQTFITACCQLLEGAKALNLPLVLTEQYPKGLGQTITDIRLLCQNVSPYEKTQFSALTPEVQAVLNEQQVKNIIIIGCETHICVLQTALDLRQRGYQVYLPQECVTSRTLSNKNNGLNQAQQAGVIISNIESLLFQLLRDAKHPQFKAISKLIQ